MIVKGQKINNRYKIEKNIGEGGMANVYLAVDTILDRNVAVKILRGDLASDEKFIRRFQREALAASSLTHPNVVEVYDVGEEDGKYYIVMEFVEGKTLKELIKKRGTLTQNEVIDIMMQLTDALTCAHESYIIHRDIKPQNILILENGLVKITDFGVAMAMNATGLTQTNSIMGTVHYLPPEQASGRGSTIKSDIYSLGIVMYELLVGKLPFKGETAVEIAIKHMKDEMPSVRLLNENISQSVENIIIKATAKNVKNRYASAKDMYDELKVCLTDDHMHDPKYELEFKEFEDDSKIMKAKKSSDEEVVAKKIDFDEVEEETKMNKFVIVAIVLFLLLTVVGIIVLIFKFIPNENVVKDVIIPDVSGLSVIDAEKVLKDANLVVNVEIKEVESDIFEDGLVVRTEPSKNRSVKEGTTITLFKSTGVKSLVIENYVGENIIEIETRLSEVHGLNVIIEKKEVTNEDIDPNAILEQSVEPGTTLRKGESIILYIPNVVIVYPDMVGKKYTENMVTTFAESNNLNLSINYRETNDYPPGIVIYQSREAGSKVVNGVSLSVTISVKLDIIPEVEPEPEVDPDDTTDDEEN